MEGPTSEAATLAEAATHSEPGVLGPAQHAELVRLRYEVKAARSEITKLHRQMNALQKATRRELAATRKAALAAAQQSVTGSGDGVGSCATAGRSMPAAPASGAGLTMAPIGHIESCFVNRNGTPRQPGLAPAARSRLRLRWGTAPAHTLEGLEEFSHVWLLFVFHRNRGDEVVKAKVHPPRLHGARTGVFACRTPHRPNPIGLSLVEIEAIEGDTVLLRGADLIECARRHASRSRPALSPSHVACVAPSPLSSSGTPVLDMKPYIPYADAPPPAAAVRAPAWVSEGNRPRIRVEMTSEARAGLTAACDAVSDAERDEGSAAAAVGGAALGQSSPASLRFFAGRAEAAEAALCELLSADPRSVYRRAKCEGEEYRVTIDGLEALCTFGESEGEEHVTVHAVHASRARASPTLSVVDGSRRGEPSDQKMDVE